MKNPFPAAVAAQGRWTVLARKARQKAVTATRPISVGVARSNRILAKSLPESGNGSAEVWVWQRQCYIVKRRNFATWFLKWTLVWICVLERNRIPQYQPSWSIKNNKHRNPRLPFGVLCHRWYQKFDSLTKSQKTHFLKNSNSHFSSVSVIPNNKYHLHYSFDKLTIGNKNGVRNMLLSKS